MAQNYYFFCIYANFSVILQRESTKLHYYFSLRAEHDGLGGDQMGPYQPP